MIKTHKKKKTGKYRGKGAGTYGWGARKKHKKSGIGEEKEWLEQEKEQIRRKTLVLKFRK